MKYLLSLLLIVFMAGCSSPAAHTVKEIGHTVEKCCTALSFPKKLAINTPVNNTPVTAEATSVSVFELNAQLVRTW